MKYKIAPTALCHSSTRNKQTQKNKMFVVLILALVGVVFAAPPSSFPIASFPGECPDIGAMKDFDVEKWSKGVWYQVYVEQSDKIHWNDQQKCIERRYKPIGKELTIEKYHVIDRKPVWGESKIVSTDTPGMFNHAPMENATEWYKKTQIYIVDTDYDTYTVAWACVNADNNIRFETGGISSRTNGLPPGKLEEITAFFKTKGSDIAMSPIDWSDCRVRCE